MTDVPLLAADIVPQSQLTLIKLLTLMHPGLQSSQIKLHCANHNGQEDPIDVFLAGKFDEWQRWQTRRNFD